MWVGALGGNPAAVAHSLRLPDQQSLATDWVTLMQPPHSCQLDPLLSTPPPTLYPDRMPAGRLEFAPYLPANCQAALIQPVGPQSVLVIGSDTQRGFTRLDQVGAAARCQLALPLAIPRPPCPGLACLQPPHMPNNVLALQCRFSGQ